ncbi:hypothetical protein ABK905_23025 [Acerihabitans sp. KWT182]|uniref:Uncharacterized protein n=1 Tax=Acerihabitans sp. KWT182 TaxID=3157919 RepID=A0AAU7QAM7_9GAMM
MASKNQLEYAGDGEQTDNKDNGDNPEKYFHPVSFLLGAGHHQDRGKLMISLCEYRRSLKN